MIASFKRNLVGGMALLFIASAGAWAKETAPRTPVDYVDPWICSKWSRYFFFSSACRPFGMVNLNPDTVLERAWQSGYRYQVPYIRGLTHIHCWGIGGFVFMPIPASVDATKGPEAWKSGFSHDREIVQAGYHQVDLLDHHIGVELTSSCRVGVHRYTFQQAGDYRVLIDLSGIRGEAKMYNAELKRVSDTELEGWVDQDHHANSKAISRLFFVVRFSEPMQDSSSFAKNRAPASFKDVTEGDQLGVLVHYRATAGQKLVVTAGLSWTSIDGARRNLMAEVPHFDFDRVRRESREEWNNLLSRVDVSGGTQEQRVKFYTDIWHSLLGRKQTEDVDGAYPEYQSTGKLVVKKLAPDKRGHIPMHLNSDAWWIGRWNIFGFWGMAYPQVLQDVCNSMLTLYKDSGRLPRGNVVGWQSDIMTGSHASEAIAGAWARGIRGFDPELAFAACRDAAMEPGNTMDRETGLIEHYRKHGWIPEQTPPHVWGGAGRTAENSFTDWAVAWFAKQIGKEDQHTYFLGQARNWTNHFDPLCGWMRPRNKDGSWFTPFDPAANSNYGGFVEANSWMTTHMICHDARGVAALIGGNDAYAARLESALKEAQPEGFEGGWNKIKMNFANQPGLGAAHLFNYVGKPWLTQKWVRAVHESVFSGTTPDSGYGREDEDQGQIGSLSALMAMGLGTELGGCGPDPIYDITAPLFDTVTIHLDPAFFPGKDFTIRAVNQAPQNVYIQSAALNGKALNRCFIYHREIAEGGELVLTLGNKPNTAWGVLPLPYSQTNQQPALKAALIDPPATIGAGEDLTLTCRSTNHGGLGAYEAELRVDGVGIEKKEVIVRENASADITFCTRLFTVGPHRIQIGNLAPFTIDVKPRSGRLVPENPSITARGGVITATATVQNRGSERKKETVALTVNDQRVTKNVDLGPGEVAHIDFNQEVATSDKFTVNLHGWVTTTLTVARPPFTEEPGLVLRLDAADSSFADIDLSRRRHHPLANPRIPMENGAYRCGGKKLWVVPDAPALNPRTALTVACWIKAEHWTQNARLFQKGMNDDQFRVIQANGKLQLLLSGINNGVVECPAPKPGAWVHVAFVFDGKAKRGEIWLNGALAVQRPSSGALPATSDPLCVGSKSTAAPDSDAFDGRMRDFRFYDRALVPEEIATLARPAK